jgi:hypothetical protein
MSTPDLQTMTNLLWFVYQGIQCWRYFETLSPEWGEVVFYVGEMALVTPER